MNRLAAADREHQKEAGGSLVLRSIKYGCAFIVAAFVLDVALHLQAGWRLALLLSFLGGVLVLAAYSVWLAYVRRNRLEHIARFLETRQPALGSRLINLLQLRQQSDDNSLAPLTRELAQLAVESYATELRDFNLTRLAWTDEVRRQLKRAAWALLVFAGVLALFFRVTAVEVVRFVQPFGDHPPYSFTQLQIVEPGPDGTNVLYGKSVAVKVAVSGHQPKEVFLTAHPPSQPDQALTLPMFDKGRGGFQQQLENVRSELVVFAHTKDRNSLSKKVRLGVVLTPQLERAFVLITPPAYTGLTPEEKAYTFQGVQALAGSELRFRLQSNRPLLEGDLELTRGEQAPLLVKLDKSADHEVAGSFVAEHSGRLRFRLLDTERIPSQEAWEGALTVTHDLPPEIQIAEPANDSVVALDFKLQAFVEARDDYGLRLVRLHRGLNGVYSAPLVKTYEGVVRHAREMLEFRFAELGVQPGDVISLFAEALDTAPEPHLARSQTIRLLVISVEDYNNFLLEQTDLADLEAKYAELKDDLEQLIEKQKELGQTAEALTEKLATADARQREALLRDLDNLLARQNELNAQLNQHAERVDQFVRAQPLYDVEKELETLLREQADAIRQSTATNNASASDIAQRSSPANAPRQLQPDMFQDFKQASDEQLARLGGVQDATQQQVVETLQDMSQMQELMKDFNQFEALYRMQQELAEQARPYNRPGQLGREDQLALKSLAATERQVAQLLEALEDKLRADADAAEKLFPKAAQSGRDLADKMKEARLQHQARQATSAMLAAEGEQSFHRAERLRQDMARMFSECQGSGNCPNAGELDQYLSLQRAMKPGNNFAQMARSRKFGLPGQSPNGLGMGAGQSGLAGYAVINGATLDVLGNEMRANRSTATARQSSPLGRGQAELADPLTRREAEQADVLKGLNPVNRQSGAVAAESLLEEYSDVVESYFKAITTGKKP